MAETQEVGSAQLKQIIERVERLNEDAKQISDDKREVFAEAKSLGFDPKVIRRVVAIRAGDPRELDEFEALVDTYLHAVGSTPRGNAEASAAFNGNVGNGGNSGDNGEKRTPPPDDDGVPNFVKKGAARVSPVATH